MIWCNQETEEQEEFRYLELVAKVIGFWFLSHLWLGVYVAVHGALTPKEALGIVLLWEGKWKYVTLGQYFWENSFNFEGRKYIDAFVIFHSGGVNLDQSLHTCVSILSARNSCVTCYSCLSSAGRGYLAGVLGLFGCGAGSLLCSVLCRWEVEMCWCSLLVL